MLELFVLTKINRSNYHVIIIPALNFENIFTVSIIRSSNS